MQGAPRAGCDSFHGIAAIREIDRQVASLSERVRARAGEREERVRGSESVVYTELIVLVFSFELDELEEGRALYYLMCFKLVIKLIKLIEKFVNY